MRNAHWRVLKEDKPNIGQIASLHFGVERLPALGSGIVVDEIVAGDGMPKVEAIACMSLVRREQGFHKKLLIALRAKREYRPGGSESHCIME
jgi:hypothetical protein